MSDITIRLDDVDVERIAQRVAALIGCATAQPKFLSLTDAAHRCGVKPHTISAARRRGELVGHARGRGYVYLATDLDAWVTSRRTPTAPDGELPDAEVIRLSVAAARRVAR